MLPEPFSTHVNQTFKVKNLFYECYSCEKELKIKMSGKCSLKRKSQTNIVEKKNQIPHKVPKKTINYNLMNKKQLIDEIQKLLGELDILKDKEIQSSNTKSNDIQIKSTQTELLDEDFTFPCQLCIYNADNELDLRIHMDYAHDFDDGIFSKITCNICEKKFQSKHRLMCHIRSKHDGSLPNCKNFQEGTCKFTDASCWFPHKMNETVLFKCRYCDETYHSKSEIMKHQKNIHEEKIQICKMHLKNSCRFRHNCWYLHLDLLKTKQTQSEDQSMSETDISQRSILFK